MQKIGVTGQKGFIGMHTFNTLGLYPDEFEIVNFNRTFFENPALLDQFVEQCDVIIHLAGMNRHSDPGVLYQTNIDLAEKLIASLKRTGSNPHIIYSSSTQENRDNPYGKSKKEARLLFSEWADKSGGKFSGVIIPNVFGPFGVPYYNSVIATFCHQLVQNELPKIEVDGSLKLIYVSELVDEIIKIIDAEKNLPDLELEHTYEIKVSEILGLLKKFKNDYLENGIIPDLKNRFELNLFNTFRSYMDIKKCYPTRFIKHDDSRGSFAEIIRLGKGVNGQVSFSTTVAGAVRGNHFHTRKIERFAVIRGKALIQLRKIGTTDISDFYLSGDEPAYVDMPIWHAHNIKNIGEEELYTIFWINEPFNPDDPDTFFEPV